MKQEMEDVPRTKREVERQRGPTPKIAFVLVVALFIAVALFYVPAILRALNT